MSEMKHSELKSLLDCGWAMGSGPEVDGRTARALDFLRRLPKDEAIGAVEQVRAVVHQEYMEANRRNSSGHVSDAEDAKRAAIEACDYVVDTLTVDGSHS